MKNGKFILIALGVVVLVVVAGGVLFFMNSGPSQSVQPPNTPRTRNTIVQGTASANGGNTQDPLDDSLEDTLPNPPAGSDVDEPTRDFLNDSPANTNNPNIVPEQTPPANQGGETPPANQAMVNLQDSGWTRMDNNQAYQFCSDNKWQASNDGGAVTAAGTFEQQGATVVLSGDGDPRMYEMSWDPAANVLALKTGDTTFNLAYKGAGNCP